MILWKEKNSNDGNVFCVSWVIGGCRILKSVTTRWSVRFLVSAIIKKILLNETLQQISDCKRFISLAKFDQSTFSLQLQYTCVLKHQMKTEIKILPLLKIRIFLANNASVPLYSSHDDNPIRGHCWPGLSWKPC